jgi:hypothetical protein
MSVHTHAHCEVATQWLHDTSLVILTTVDGKLWFKCLIQRSPSWQENNKYFLVCEKHVDVALDWLNGCGEIEASYHRTGRVTPFSSAFHSDHNYRIKGPKKVVKEMWVGVSKDTSRYNIIRTATQRNCLSTYLLDQYTWTYTALNMLEDPS